MAKQIDTAALMFELGRLMKSRLSVFGLPTMQQLEALRFVAEREQPTMRELASYLMVKAPTATSLAADLVKARLVARGSSGDRRLVRLKLTQGGKKALELSTIKRRKVITDLLETLSNKDKEEFKRILSTIVSNNR